MGMSATAFELTTWVFIACAAAMLARLIFGPTVADRLMALSVVSALVLGLLVIGGLRSGRAAFLDVALVYDIFGFLGILAIANLYKAKAPGALEGARPGDRDEASEGGSEP